MVTQTATDIELIAIRWLEKRNISFEFQSSLMGGFFELGGAVVDFLFAERNMLWRIMGDYWHQNIGTEGRDMLQRELLESEGWRVVDIWGSDITERTEETLTKALRGQEMLR